MNARIMHPHWRQIDGILILFDPTICPFADVPGNEETFSLILSGHIEGSLAGTGFDADVFGDCRPATVEEMRKLIGGLK